MTAKIIRSFWKRCVSTYNCNGNLVKTSQALFIHRNTLLYRLNQIRDLLGRDIDDALVRLELLSSIVAKDYLGE